MGRKSCIICRRYYFTRSELPIDPRRQPQRTHSIDVSGPRPERQTAERVRHGGRIAGDAHHVGAESGGRERRQQYRGQQPEHGGLDAPRAVRIAITEFARAITFLQQR